MTETEFTTFDIQKKLGIPIGRLKEWTKRGFITPSIQKANGRGTKAIFSREDLSYIVSFNLLVNRGFSRALASEYLKKLDVIRRRS